MPVVSEQTVSSQECRGDKAERLWAAAAYKTGHTMDGHSHFAKGLMLPTATYLDFIEDYILGLRRLVKCYCC